MTTAFARKLNNRMAMSTSAEPIGADVSDSVELKLKKDACLIPYRYKASVLGKSLDMIFRKHSVKRIYCEQNRENLHHFVVEHRIQNTHYGICRK